MGAARGCCGELGGAIPLKMVVLMNLPAAGQFHFAFRLTLSDGTKIAEMKGNVEAAKAVMGMIPIGPFQMNFAKPGSFALQFQSAP